MRFMTLQSMFALSGGRRQTLPTDHESPIVQSQPMVHSCTGASPRGSAIPTGMADPDSAVRTPDPEEPPEDIPRRPCDGQRGAAVPAFPAPQWLRLPARP
jgi:hypothetical protein